MKQNKFIYAHMKVAEIYANLSSAKRLKVGAILVKDNRILSIGYNGTPSGWDNDCEEREYIKNPENYKTSEDVYEDENGFYKLKTKQIVIHAESNCLSKIAQSNESSKGSTMFVTHSPCLECSKLIYQSGVLEVYYKHEYRSDDGIDFLNEAGVYIHQLMM